LEDASSDGASAAIATRNEPTRDALLLRDTVREAGALALSLFRTDLRNWTKGASSPVSEADIAVNELISGRLRPATPHMVGCRKRVSTTNNVSTSSVSGSSIRSTAPAVISPVARIGASASHWSRARGRYWPRYLRRQAMNSSSPSEGETRCSMAHRLMRRPALQSTFPAWRVPNH
jgi:3'-phosphoadenosine 5'-phosphosulfate (PAPS) 3'-phosphatase